MKADELRIEGGPNYWAALIGAALAASLSGCASMDWAKSVGSTAAKCERPTKILALVTPAELKENGAQAQQGIMCRLYFFANSNPVPIKVDGDVSITAYDRSKTDPKRPPDGKYDIAATKLPTHYRKDMVGDSYLFWLPYTPTCQTQMSVQARFKDKQGNETVSDVVQMALDPLTAPAAGAPPALSTLAPPPPGKTQIVRTSPAKAAVLQAPIAAN